MKKTFVNGFWGKLSVETRWFIVLAVLFGITFVVILPPRDGPDEGVHYARAWQITAGHICAEKDEDMKGVYGGWIPQNLLIIDNEPASRRFRMWAAFPNNAPYSPVSYTPSLLSISLIRLFDVNSTTAFYMVRFFHLLFFITGIALALNALRGTRAQWLVFAVALLPRALFQASVITADTTTNTFAILFSALLIKSLFLAQKLSRRETVLFLVCAATIPILKTSYAWLSLLIFLVPLANFAIRRPRLGQWTAIFVGFTLFTAWAIATSDVANYIGIIGSRYGLHIVPAEQLQFLLHHPLDILKIALNTFSVRGYEFMTGFFGGFQGAYGLVADSTMILCICMLGLSVFVCEKTKIPRRYPLIILADVLIVVLMIFAILYLTYTPVGENIVHGGTGRYFIPVIILGLSAIGALMQRFKPAESRWYEVAPRLLLYGTMLSLLLTAFNFVYFVGTFNQ